MIAEKAGSDKIDCPTCGKVRFSPSRLHGGGVWRSLGVLGTPARCPPLPSFLWGGGGGYPFAWNWLMEIVFLCLVALLPVGCVDFWKPMVFNPTPN